MPIRPVHLDRADAEAAVKSLCDESEFEVYVNGDYIAGCSGPRDRAWSEAMTYAVQYKAGGAVTVSIVEVTRQIVSPGPTAPAKKG